MQMDSPFPPVAMDTPFSQMELGSPNWEHVECSLLTELYLLFERVAEQCQTPHGRKLPQIAAEQNTAVDSNGALSVPPRNKNKENGTELLRGGDKEDENEDDDGKCDNDDDCEDYTVDEIAAFIAGLNIDEETNNGREDKDSNECTSMNDTLFIIRCCMHAWKQRMI